MLPTRGDGLLTTAQAAEMVRASPATIRSWVNRGYLSAWGVDHGRKLYLRESVREAERAVRERGIEASGVDPRRLRKPRARAAV